MSSLQAADGGAPEARRGGRKPPVQRSPAGTAGGPPQAGADAQRTRGFHRSRGLVGEDGRGGHRLLRVAGPAGELVMSCQGGQLLSAVPAGGRDLLWVSPQAVWQPGQPLRGGVPVCWPWLGRHPTDDRQPLHGPLRTAAWEPADGGSDGEASWLACRIEVPRLRARLTVRARLDRRALHVQLRMENLGDLDLITASGLHTYLAVDDAAAIRLEGLAGRRWVGSDPFSPMQLDAAAWCAPDGAEMTRTYHDALPVVLVDGARRLVVERSGSQRLVIWNPGEARAAALPDLGPGAWRGCICLEAANTDGDARTIPPGGIHCLGQRIAW